MLVTEQVGFLSLPAFEEMERKETHCSLTSALWPCLPGGFYRARLEWHLILGALVRVPRQFLSRLVGSLVSVLGDL